MTNTVVVTGVGVAAPNGLGHEEFWAATLRGESGIRPVTRFDASQYPLQVAGEIRGFVPEEHLPSRLIPQTDRMTHLALAASDWALKDAGSFGDDLDPVDTGVVTAASSGGFEFGQRELENLWHDGSKYVSAYMSFAWFYAVNSGQVSIRNNLRGPSGVFVSEQAGGLDAIAHARRMLNKGRRVVVSGGMDGSLCPFGWVAHLAGGRLAHGADPDHAYLPFDRAATGHVPGEGGAILVMERAGASRDRGAAHVYGEIAGYAATFDPRPDLGRPPGLRRAAELALADAKMNADEVDVVFADAAGDPDLDRKEATAIAQVFGAKAVPTTAPKSMTGRLYSGGASLDVVTALLAMRDGLIPPTVNTAHQRPDCPIDLVIDIPREAKLRAALILARGKGGFNSAMVVRSAAK